MTGKLSGGCLVPIGTLSNVSDRDMPPRRRGGSRRTRQTARVLITLCQKGYGLHYTLRVSQHMEHLAAKMLSRSIPDMRVLHLTGSHAGNTVSPACEPVKFKTRVS